VAAFNATSRPSAVGTNTVPSATAAGSLIAVERFGLDVRLDIGWFVTLHHDERPDELCVIERDHEAVPPGCRAPPAGVIVSFMVDDVDACAARLADGGTPVVVLVRDEPTSSRSGHRPRVAGGQRPGSGAER
jgi:hypothetical protein